MHSTSKTAPESRSRGRSSGQRVDDPLNESMSSAARQLLDELGLQQQHIVARSDGGLSAYTVSYLLSNKQMWTLGHIRRFCEAAGVEVSVLFERSTGRSEPVVLGVRKVGVRYIDERKWLEWLRDLRAPKVLEVAAEMIREIDSVRGRSNRGQRDSD